MSTFVGVDPGFQGAITILSGQKKPRIFDIPIKILKKGKKIQKSYNLEALRDIFKEIHQTDKDAVVGIENVSVRFGEGRVSAFNFGKGIGQLQMAIVMLGFEMKLITPQTWKKSFPEIITDEMLKMREQAKKVTGKVKTTLNRKFKELAKTEARILSQKLYPDIAGMFARKKDDGRAESLLIAVHLKMEKNK